LFLLQLLQLLLLLLLLLRHEKHAEHALGLGLHGWRYFGGKLVRKWLETT
jgi:hypothetical protein